MVTPMMGRPPQRPFLRGHCPKPAQRKLKSPAGFIAAVRKIAVVARRDGEHAKPVHDQTNGHCRRAYAGPDDKQTGEMHEQERQAPQNINSFVKIVAHEETPMIC